MVVRDDWWVSEIEGGFFGPHYILGDNSKLGPYLAKKMSLNERTRREVDFIVQVLELKPGDEVLDCPCGYGRHSILLAQRGIKTVGVDLNDAFLDLARALAKEQKLDQTKVEFIKGDMRDVPVKAEGFDAIVNIFTSFGFFPDKTQDLAVLKAFYRALKAGGRLLLHFDYNFERRVKGKRDERVTRYLKDGSRLIITETPPNSSNRITGKWEIIQSNNKQVYTRSYSLTLYSPSELRHMLSEAGLEMIQTKGDLDDYTVDLTPHSLETVIIAKK